MAILNNGDKIQQWRYHVSEFQVLIPGEESIKIPKERLVGMNLIEDFEKNAFPLFKIDLVLEPSVYYKIMENKENEQIHLRIDKYFYYVDSNSKSIYQKFINDNFNLIMDENTEDMYKSLKEQENKNDYTKRIKSDNGEIEKAINHLSLYLFKTSIIDGTKENVNTVLDDACITDALAYVATVGNLNNILMAPSDNMKKYPSLLIPPMSVLKEFCFLDTYYGIYKEGTIIYFGLNISYIIPYNGKCEAYTNDEIRDISIVIPKSDGGGNTLNLGSVVKTTDITHQYIIASYRTIGINNESISNNYLEANNIKAIDTYSGNIIDSKAEEISKKPNFTKLYENKTENEFIASVYTSFTNALSVVIKLRLEDFDVTDIAPNKRFGIIFEDSNLINKYKGNYILANANHAFILEGEDFAISSTVTLKKEV